MAEVEDYLNVLDLGFYEVTFAFEGLADAHVWRRPAPGLLSVGELAGHVAYWEAVRLAGEGVERVPGEGGEELPDPARCAVQSPLVDRRFAYYTTTMAAPPSEAHRAMTAPQVRDELLRVHAEAVAHLRARDPRPEGSPPGWAPELTYGEMLRYMAFHVAYHTGQMYSARHLLGEQTPDN